MPRPPFQGRLLFIDATGVNILQLPSGNAKSLLATNDAVPVYASPTLVSPTVLVFSTGDQRLLEFHVDSKILTDVNRGYWPTFIREKQLLFFSRDRDSDGSSLTELHMRNFGAGRGEDRVVANWVGRWSTHVVQVSPDAVVFNEKKGEVWEYEISTQALTRTGITGCVVRGWRSRTQQLICEEASGSHYYLTDLNGSNHMSLTSDFYGSYVCYVPQYDMFVYNANTGSLWPLEIDVWGLFAYTFVDSKSWRLGLAAPVISGGVWLSN